MKNTEIVKIVMIAGGIAAAAIPLGAGEKALPVPERRKIFRGHMAWRAFSQLNEPERKKMQALQRSDPERFAAEMKLLAEKYEKKEIAWRGKMRALIAQYRRSSDVKEKEKIKAEITKMETERFQQRISALAKTIAVNKLRVAMMEKELKKRRERSKDIVEARVDAILTGEIPLTPALPKHHIRHRGMGKSMPRLPEKMNN